MFNNILLFYNKNCNLSKKLKDYLYKNSKKCFLVDNSNPKKKVKIILKKNLYFDYIFSFRNYYILKKDIIKKANIAAINFHPGTPEYRGVGCINYALYDNAKIYGSTAHIINEKIDNGQIINIKKFKIPKNITLDACLKKTHKIMYTQAMEIFKKLKTTHNAELLNKWIENHKQIKWSNKLKNRRKLDIFYKLDLTKTKLKIENKIKSTYTKDFYPYIEIKNNKYYLLKKKDMKFKN